MVLKGWARETPCGLRLARLPKRGALRCGESRFFPARTGNALCLSDVTYGAHFDSIHRQSLYDAT